MNPYVLIQVPGYIWIIIAINLGIVAALLLINLFETIRYEPAGSVPRKRPVPPQPAQPTSQEIIDAGFRLPTGVTPMGQIPPENVVV